MTLANNEKFFLVASALYAVVLILSNLAGGKLTPSPFNEGLVSASLFLYPLSYFTCDLIAEIFGAKRARFTILLGFSMAVLMHGMAHMLIAFPASAASQQYQHSLEALFSFNGLSLAASLTAFLISQLLDVKIYLWIREKTGTKKLWLRTNASTIVSQIVDTFVINVILFFWILKWPMLEVFDLFISATLLKIAFSILLTPFFYAAVLMARRFLDLKPTLDSPSIAPSRLADQPELL